MSTPLLSSVDELLALDRPVKFLFFWGHQPRRDGSIGAECLSQWAPTEFTVDGVSFRSAEHYMMWRKAMLFGDTAMAARIVKAGHPRDAKNLGRGVAGFNERTWVDNRFRIVVEASRAKFSQHPDLRDWLLGTGNRILVEASPLDRIWGIGLRATDEGATDPTRWRGQNLLGFALMHARAAL